MEVSEVGTVEQWFGKRRQKGTVDDEEEEEEGVQL